GGEPDPLRDRGERGEHGERLGAADHVQVVDAALVLAEAQPFREEEEVELAALRGAGQVDEGGEVDLAARPGVGPDRRVVHAGEVRGQVHLLARPLPRRAGPAPAVRPARRGGYGAPALRRPLVGWFGGWPSRGPLPGTVRPAAGGAGRAGGTRSAGGVGHRSSPHRITHSICRKSMFWSTV